MLYFDLILSIKQKMSDEHYRILIQEVLKTFDHPPTQSELARRITRVAIQHIL